jgi:hypothetical protein
MRPVVVAGPILFGSNCVLKRFHITIVFGASICLWRAILSSISAIRLFAKFLSHQLPPLWVSAIN